MGVRDEPVRRRHEGPGLAAQVEPQLQLGHAPVGLHGRPGIPLDRQALVDERPHRGVVHRVVERFHRRREIRRQRTAPPGRDKSGRDAACLRRSASRISSPPAGDGPRKAPVYSTPEGRRYGGRGPDTNREAHHAAADPGFRTGLSRSRPAGRSAVAGPSRRPPDRSERRRPPGVRSGPHAGRPGWRDDRGGPPRRLAGPDGQGPPLATALRRRRGMASHRDRRGVAGRPRGDGSGLRGGARGRARQRTRPGRRPDEPRRGRSPGGPRGGASSDPGGRTARPTGPCS